MLQNGLFDITCLFESCSPCGSIYISGLQAASSQAVLRRLHIGAIATVCRGVRLQHSEQMVPYYRSWPIDDHAQFNISKYFDESFEFIDMSRRTANVLVHCKAGISRSATIIAAYLIRKYSYSWEDVLNILKRKRTKVQRDHYWGRKGRKRVQLLNSQGLFVHEQFSTNRNSYIIGTNVNTAELKGKLQFFKIQYYTFDNTQQLSLIIATQINPNPGFIIQLRSYSVLCLHLHHKDRKEQNRQLDFQIGIGINLLGKIKSKSKSIVRGAHSKQLSQNGEGLANLSERFTHKLCSPQKQAVSGVSPIKNHRRRLSEGERKVVQDQIQSLKPQRKAEIFLEGNRADNLIRGSEVKDQAAATNKQNVRIDVESGAEIIVHSQGGDFPQTHAATNGLCQQSQPKSQHYCPNGQKRSDQIVIDEPSQPNQPQQQQTQIASQKNLTNQHDSSQVKAIRHLQLSTRSLHESMKSNKPAQISFKESQALGRGIKHFIQNQCVKYNKIQLSTEKDKQRVKSILKLVPCDSSGEQLKRDEADGDYKGAVVEKGTNQFNKEGALKIKYQNDQQMAQNQQISVQFPKALTIQTQYNRRPTTTTTTTSHLHHGHRRTDKQMSYENNNRLCSPNSMFSTMLPHSQMGSPSASPEHVKVKIEKLKSAMINKMKRIGSTMASSTNTKQLDGQTQQNGDGVFSDNKSTMMSFSGVMTEGKNGYSPNKQVDTVKDQVSPLSMTLSNDSFLQSLKSMGMLGWRNKSCGAKKR